MYWLLTSSYRIIFGSSGTSLVNLLEMQDR